MAMLPMGILAARRLPNSATIHFFLINGTSGTASFASNTISPTLPSGYTYYRRIFSLNTTSAGALRPVNAAIEAEGGSAVFYLTTQLLDVNTSSITTTITLLTLSVPNGLRMSPLTRALGGTSTPVFVLLLSGDETTVAPSGSVAPLFDLTTVASGSNSSNQEFLTTNASGQIGAIATSATQPLQIVTRGWKDFRRS